ncbi:MAG: ComF family protein [Cellulosilyticaceae bacterium]
MKLQWQQWKKFIYPNKCIVCGQIIEAINTDNICDKCMMGQFNQSEICEVCGKPYGNEKMCLWCREMPQCLDKVQSLFPYKGYYKESIKRWKYDGFRKYGISYGKLIGYTLKEQNLDKEYDAIIPIPLAPNRYKKRGFNQAYDLAVEVGKILDVPVYDMFYRIGDMKPQSDCKKEERYANIKNRIAIYPNIFNGKLKNILFVDDIYTTGSTVRECVQVIRKMTNHDEKCIYHIVTVCMASEG